MSEPMMVQIDDIVRPATAEEIANYNAVTASYELQKQTAEETLEARKAPLRKLGLTDEEINTVLGL